MTRLRRLRREGPDHGLERIDGFAAATREEFAGESSSAITTAHIARAADAARSGPAAAAPAAPGARAAPVLRTRIAHAAAIAAAIVVAAPLALGGLAYAGVSLPGPAIDAFETVGVSLPNQDDEDAPGEGAADGPGPANAPTVAELVEECDGEPVKGGEFGECVAERASSFGKCVNAAARSDVRNPANACEELKRGKDAGKAKSGKAKKDAKSKGRPDTGRPESTPGARPDGTPGGGRPETTPGAKPDGTPGGGGPQTTPGGKPDGTPGGGKAQSAPNERAGGALNGRPETTPLLPDKSSTDSRGAKPDLAPGR